MHEMQDDGFVWLNGKPGRGEEQLGDVQEGQEHDVSVAQACQEQSGDREQINRQQTQKEP